MESWVSSSVVVATFRAAARTSIVLRSCRTLLRLLTRHLAALRSAPTFSIAIRFVTPFQYSGIHRVAMLADESWVLGGMERVFNLSVTAWHQSAARTWLRVVLNSSTATDIHATRLAGWMGLSAALTHILLTGLETIVTEPGGGLGWLAVIPIAVACVWNPEAVVAAWKVSHFRHWIVSVKHRPQSDAQN